MSKTILELAQDISGAGEAEQELLELLCGAAEQAWTKRLRDGLTEEDYIAFPDEGLEEGMKTSEYQDVESENEELPEYEEGDIPSMPVGGEVPVG